MKGVDNAIFAVAAIFAFAVFGTFASDVRAVGFGGKSGVPESGLPILGWWIIPERFVSRERFREAREAGFTHMMQDAKTVGQMRSYLDMAHAEGIMLSARLPQLHTEPENTVRALMNHPALSTWHIEDEPSAHKFAKLGEIVRRIQSVDSGHPCYVNLLADSSDPIRWLGVADYRVYLGRALKEMSLPLISADFYPCILENNMLQVSVVGDGDVLARYKEILKDHLAVVEFRKVRFTLQQLHRLQDALTAKLPQGSWSGIGVDESGNCVVVSAPQDIEAVRSIVRADPEFQGMPITYEIMGFASVT